MSTSWTPERTQKFKATFARKRATGWAKKRATRTKGWSPERRARQEATLAQRIATARPPKKRLRQADAQDAIFIESKPKGLVSWWLVGQTPESRAEWHQRASQEVERMSGSKEAKTLGFRRTVDDISPRHQA